MQPQFFVWKLPNGELVADGPLAAEAIKAWYKNQLPCLDLSQPMPPECATKLPVYAVIPGTEHHMPPVVA